ncbi:hypothetical protein V865_008496 [Kwoniella europaea PYCC6329]|uniref:Uncharacterized protein n=1 Tax=Kwoniella europaea PYCC6329 TaxID=1423913 RepID=A0AAX4KV85_9TREE
MLSSIRHLHFVYDFIKVPENQEDEWIFGFKLIDYWENIPNLSRVIEGCKESIKQIERFHLNDVHHHSLQLGLFRKLKTVSFGYKEKLFFPDYRSYDQFRQIEKQKQRQHQRQIIISPNQARAYSKKEVESISSSWMENIQSLIKPLHICREVVNGPLGFGFSSSTRINSSPHYGSVPHTYTLHYSSRHRMSDQIPNYIYGTLNRLILEDVVLEDFGGEAEEDEDEDDERFRAVRVFNWICDITMSQFIPERNTKSSSSMMSHNGKTIVPDTTRIRVYSTMDWKEINEGRKLLLIDPIYGPIVNTDRSISMRQPVDIDDTDTPTPRKPVCQLQTPKLVENGVVIELMRMKDAGTCPACGAHGEFGRCPTI